MIKGFDMQLLDRLAKQYYLTTTSKKMKSKIITSYAKLCNIKRDTAKKRFLRYMPKIKNNNKNNKYLNIKSPPRPPKYNQIHKDIVKYIWEFSDYLCAERLFPICKIYISQLLNNPNDKFKYIFEINDIEFVANSMSLGSLKKLLLSFQNLRKKDIIILTTNSRDKYL